MYIKFHVSRGSSVIIVSGYGLDDRAIEVPRQRQEDFSSSLCVRISSGTHPDSYPMRTGVLPQRLKCGGGVTLTTHALLVPRSRMSRSYNSFLPKRLRGVQWDSFCVQTGSGAWRWPLTSSSAEQWDSFCVQTGSGAWRWPLTSSSAEVENEQELYLLSPQAPSWRIVEQFSFLTLDFIPEPKSVGPTLFSTETGTTPSGVHKSFQRL
jgi:hypothetical protein